MVRWIQNGCGIIAADMVRTAFPQWTHLMITIAPLSINDLPDWSAMLAESFRKPVAQMQRQLCWLHQAPTTGQDICSPVVAYGSWEDTRLVGQYSCLLRSLHIPNQPDLVMVGMSLNMAVHPDFRGRGLIKQMAAPVYERLQSFGAVAGVGFSNASGVKVDRHSKGYGYSVVGQMMPTLYWLPPPFKGKPSSVRLTDHLTGGFSDDIFQSASGIGFMQNVDWLCHRYDAHPSRRYQYGIWNDADGNTRGIVVYRAVRMAGVAGVSLLAAYASPDNLHDLLSEWTRKIRQSGGRFIHVLTSAGSSLGAALKGIGIAMRVPYSRSPSYLTVKPLTDSANTLLDFAAWDCDGGDIL